MSVTVVFDISGQVADRIRAGVHEAIQGGARAITQEAQDSIRSRAKSGRRYSRRGQSWTASAPGEPPANVTGALASSITPREIGQNAADVLATADIAYTMEFGTAGGKVAPRPFMEPAARTKEPEVVAAVIQAVRRSAGG